MIAVLISLLLLSLAALIQAVLIPYLRVFGIGPDLILITACSIAFIEGQNIGTISGFAGGLIGDLVGSRIVGLSSLTKTITGYLAGSMQSGLTEDNTILPAGLMIAFSLINRVMYIFLSFLIAQPLAKGFGVVGYLIIGPLYDALLTMPVFIISRKVLARRPTGEYVKEYSNIL